MPAEIRKSFGLNSGSEIGLKFDLERNFIVLKPINSEKYRRSDIDSKQISTRISRDYITETNHTLPTNKAAKYTSGLSVKDFIITDISI